MCERVYENSVHQNNVHEGVCEGMLEWPHLHIFHQYVCPVVQQQRCEGAVAHESGAEQRRLPLLVVGRLCVGTNLQQRLHHIHMTPRVEKVG